MTLSRWSARLIVLMAAMLVGCGGPKADAQKKQTSHVRVLTMMYNSVSAKLGRHPKDEQEFKDTLRKSDVSLEALKVDSIDELFVSERDGQPLVVVYGPTTPGSDVVVYEQTGVNGMRLVGHEIGMVEEVDEQRFRELVPATAAAK